MWLGWAEQGQTMHRGPRSFPTGYGSHQCLSDPDHVWPCGFPSQQPGVSAGAFVRGLRWTRAWLGHARAADVEEPGPFRLTSSRVGSGPCHPEQAGWPPSGTEAGLGTGQMVRGEQPPLQAGGLAFRAPSVCHWRGLGLPRGGGADNPSDENQCHPLSCLWPLRGSQAHVSPWKQHSWAHRGCWERLLRKCNQEVTNSPAG